MAEMVKQTRPVRGALWGFLLGLGLALLAINSKIISLAIVPMLLVVIVGIGLGVAWSMFGPAKQPSADS